MRRHFQKLTQKYFLLFFVFLVSCQSLQTNNPEKETPTTIYSATETALAIQVTTSTSAPKSQLTKTATTETSVVILDTPSNLFPTLPKQEIFPTTAPDPFRFVFPTPEPAPVSAWRPPLYPIPWALTPYDHFYFARPIATDEVNWPLANYRYGAVFFEDEVHTGIDINAPLGTPVLAAGDGKVIWTGYGLYSGLYNDLSDPYGQAVVIRHNFGYQGQQLYTVYGHLGQIIVAIGQHLETGDILGLVGETGRVTGPHLHFEVRIDASGFFKTRNPELWLAPAQGWGVMAARIMGTSGELLYNGETEAVIKGRGGDQIWRARPYALESVSSDPYYNENMVVSDLPAGEYEVFVSYGGQVLSDTVDIQPGRVSFFLFYGRNGFYKETSEDSRGNLLPDPINEAP